MGESNLRNSEEIRTTYIVLVLSLLVRNSTGNMASFQVLCFLFSILCVNSIYSIQGKTKVIYGGDRSGLDCPQFNHVQITNVHFKMRKPIEPSQNRVKKAWDNLESNQNQIKTNIKKFCQRRQTCDEKLPIDFGGQDVNRIQITIEFDCISQGCPHPRFLDKHIMRFIGDPPENMNTVAENIAIERVQLHAKGTKVMDLFVDPTNYMEYESVKESGKDWCRFQTRAPKYHCKKNEYNSWHCEKAGEHIAIHDPITGHYKSV
uniref:Uncharacterized protein n=2 Tax=Cacopsylla melanoneura TaxID=428564 RepID=A0A8D8U9N0_9HEMI